MREHTEELGVLKATGFSKPPVLVLIMLESWLVAILGGFGGLAIAWLVTLGGSPVPSMRPLFFIPTNNLILGALLASAFGVGAGAIPAFQAMHLKISEALRRGG